MIELLEKPAVPPPSKSPSDRRQLLDRRRRVSSLIEFYRWLSALTLKVSGLFAIAILAIWWQKSPSRSANPSGIYSESTYRWHGYHRVAVETTDR
jgi:hypothetical protein